MGASNVRSQPRVGPRLAMKRAPSVRRDSHSRRLKATVNRTTRKPMGGALPRPRGAAQRSGAALVGVDGVWQPAGTR